MAAAKAMDVWSSMKLKAQETFDPEKKVTFSNQSLRLQLTTAQSLGREAAYEPRYHRTAWRDEMFNATLQEMQDVRHSLSTLERIMAEGGRDGADKVPYHLILMYLSTVYKVTYGIVLYCIVLYCIVLYCIVLYSVGMMYH